MLSKITFAFLKAVKENNNLEWMNKNRDLYHMERDNFLGFSKELIEKISKMDKSIGELQVKNATFRFNKDIRFSKDKSPYKTNFGVIIREDGKRGIGAGYYIHIEPGKSFIGGGIYLPPGSVLQRLRIYIAKNYKQLEKIVANPTFKKTFGCLIGEELKKIPRGFDSNHKAGKLLKMKSRFVKHDISDKVVLEKNFIEHCLSIAKIQKPLNDFLNKGVFYTPTK